MIMDSVSFPGNMLISSSFHKISFENTLMVTKQLVFAYIAAAAAAAKSLQSCPTLCDPIDGSSRGSAVPGILQARITGVGCHFLLQCMKVKSEREVAQ